MLLPLHFDVMSFPGGGAPVTVVESWPIICIEFLCLGSPAVIVSIWFLFAPCFCRDRLPGCNGALKLGKNFGNGSFAHRCRGPSTKGKCQGCYSIRDGLHNIAEHRKSWFEPWTIWTIQNTLQFNEFKSHLLTWASTSHRPRTWIKHCWRSQNIFWTTLATAEFITQLNLNLVKAPTKTPYETCSCLVCSVCLFEGFCSYRIMCQSSHR